MVAGVPRVAVETDFKMVESMNILPTPSAESWHSLRAKNIGGSEVAALFSLSPYQTRFELWHVKSGNVPAPAPDDERVQAGNFMEPAIAAWASQKWGVELRKFSGYVTHPTVAGMGCTPDYVNKDGSLIVQVKNVDGLEFYKNPQWDSEGEVLTKAPMHILLQCQHEMACTGIKQGWLVVCVGGNRLLRMEIAQRPLTIAKLETEVAAFWRSISDGVEPKPVFQADADTIAVLNSEVAAGKVIDLSTSNRAHEVAANWLAGKAAENAGKAAADGARAELLQLIGDAETATVGDMTIKASSVKGNAGKKITAGMIGMVIGARKGYRSFEIKQQESKNG